jgi:hypothetical protein
MRALGADDGPPKFPKSAPVPVVQVPESRGPAWERSTLELPPVETAVVELEFT